MPTYDYLCEACGKEFEQFQSIAAKPLRKCPSCSKLKLKRLIGIGAGVIFKGSGFYETDYRSDSYKKDAKAEKEANSKSKPKGETSKAKGDGSKPSSDASKSGGDAPSKSSKSKGD